MCNSTILFVGIVCSAARAIWSACGVSIVSCGGLSPYCSWRFLLKQTVAWFFLGATWFEKVLSMAHFPNMDIDTGMPTFTVYKVFVAAWVAMSQQGAQHEWGNCTTIFVLNNKFIPWIQWQILFYSEQVWMMRCKKKCCFPTFLSTNTFPYLSQKCLVTWSKYWRRKRTMMWNAFAIICCIETRRFAWFAVTFSQNCERQCAATCPYSSDDSGNALVVTMQWWWWWWWWWWLAVYDIR